LAEVSHHVETASAGKSEVDQRNLGALLTCAGHRAVVVGGTVGIETAIAKRPNEACPELLVIVDDEDRPGVFGSGRSQRHAVPAV